MQADDGLPDQAIQAPTGAQARLNVIGHPAEEAAADPREPVAVADPIALAAAALTAQAAQECQYCRAAAGQ